MSGTPLKILFDAFLSKLETDDWEGLVDRVAEEDFLSILKSALPFFRFPRVSLKIDEENQEFTNDVTEEIEVISYYMVYCWYSRLLLSYNNIKDQYVESDFSQANILAKLTSLKAQVLKDANKVQENYYRSREGRSYRYSNLYGGANG